MNKEVFEMRISSLRSQLLLIAASRLPPIEAEDAVQNAILSAWTHLPQLRNEDAFDAWIKRILVNECNLMLRNDLRQREANIKIIREAQTAQPAETPPLREALAEMDPEGRALLLLHHEQGFSISEISKRSGCPENAVKMRLYRARKRLRLILISLLILLLGMAAAAGTGIFDVPWFMANRRAAPVTLSTETRTNHEALCISKYLTAEITDAIWDMDKLLLHFTHSLSGTNEEVLTVYSSNIGVDGVRQDHIWIDGQILSVKDWAQGRTVHTYHLNGWKAGERSLSGSEDFLPDGKGEAFLASLHFDSIDPREFQSLVSEDGRIKLESEVIILDYASGDELERVSLTVIITSPGFEEWRTAYEEYYR